jgi:OmpA-OmpF porin, OOP family
MEIGKRPVRIAALAAFLGAVPALAQAGVYIGGSWGAYRINESELRKNDDLLTGFVGVKFTDWFGIEGSWTDFNRVDNGTSRFDADGKGLAAVISAPIGRFSSIFAKAGQFWWDANSRLGAAVGDRDGNDPFFGAGLNLGFNRNVALRLEADRYDVSNVDLDTGTIGLQLLF